MTQTLRVPDYLGHILTDIERIDRYTTRKLAAASDRKS